MVVSDAIHNIMGGMESTAGVRLHNHRRKLKQRFDIIKKLGQGTYGKVQLGINKETGQEVAIKTIKKSKIETEADLIRIRREIQIMSSVQHPNIIHIYEVFENREKMVLVMEHAAGGELYDFLSERKVLAEAEARRIFRQISTAVYYCHKHNICHRDLKLENILLDEHGSAKIADFGLSNVFDCHHLLGTFCGSPLYASPEIVKGTPYRGPEVDCWSLGVLLYTLVYGAMPFDGSNFKRLVKQISQGDYFEPKKPSPASALIRAMLHVDPATRADIVSICSHWWLNEGEAESCVALAEHLANQTPVRLDLLLSLAPPPTPPPGGEAGAAGKDLVAGGSAGIAGPARSQSVGSLPRSYEPSAGKRRASAAGQEAGSVEQEAGGAGQESAKRKLEEGSSTELANHGGAKRKDRSRHRERSAERTAERKHRSGSRSKQPKPTVTKATEPGPIPSDEPPTSSVHPVERPTDDEGERRVSAEAAADVEAMEVDQEPSEAGRDVEAETSAKLVAGETDETKEAAGMVGGESSKPVLVAEATETCDDKLVEEAVDSAQRASDESKKVKVKRKKKVDAKVDDAKEVASTVDEVKATAGQDEKCEGGETAVPGKQDGGEAEVCSQAAGVATVATATGEKVTEAGVDGSKAAEVKEVKAKVVKKVLKKKSDSTAAAAVDKAPPADEPPPPATKPMARRRSKIFESEIQKFNNMSVSTTELKSPTVEKPKKVFIPGVKVSDFKRAYERKSSVDLSSTTSVPSRVKTSPTKKADKEADSDVSVSESSASASVAKALEKEAVETLKKDIEKIQKDMSVKKDDVGPAKGADVVSVKKVAAVKKADSTTAKKDEVVAVKAGDVVTVKDDAPTKRVDVPTVKSVESDAEKKSDVATVKKVDATPKKSEVTVKKGDVTVKKGDVAVKKGAVAPAASKPDSIDKPIPEAKVVDKPVVVPATTKAEVADDRKPVLSADPTRDKPVAAGDLTREKPVAAGDATKEKPVAAGDATKEKPVAAGDDELNKIKKKNAIEIIGNAIAKPPKPLLDKLKMKGAAIVKPPPQQPPTTETAKKVDASPTVGSASSPLSPTGKKFVKIQVGPNDIRNAVLQVSTPEQIKNFSYRVAARGAAEGAGGDKENSAQNAEGSKKVSSKVEITLKSATLPRRKTSKAEIQLGAPPGPPPGEYRSEVEHMVGAVQPAGRLRNQRSEVAFPVAAAAPQPHRSVSVEPEGGAPHGGKPRERIIPIQFEREASVSSPPPPSKPPPGPALTQQRSVQSQRSNSMSRQSTLDSDSESVTGPEPIRKSPREFIIPIAVEGGGYVTPRAGSLEPGPDNPPPRVHRFAKPLRMGSLLSDGGASDDEGFNSLSSPFASMSRHRDADDDFGSHMHRLRSTRPVRQASERADSGSDDDDDDDDGFELLTAESLFSTLLSRVRNLTQRLNVDEGGRTGFPSSRFMNHNFPSHSAFFANAEPLSSRRVSESTRPMSRDDSLPGWRRSASRDRSDCDSVYSESANSNATTLPRGSSRSDFDDASCASDSFYTPSLARRIHLGGNPSLPPPCRPISRTTSLKSNRLPSLGAGFANRSTDNLRPSDRYPPRADPFVRSESMDRSAEYGAVPPAAPHHLPPTRRALAAMNGGSNSLPRPRHQYRSSASDSDYARPRRPLSHLSEEVDTPPPGGSYGGRRGAENGVQRSTSYLRQRALDIASIYGAPLPAQEPTRLERDDARSRSGTATPTNQSASNLNAFDDNRFRASDVPGDRTLSRFLRSGSLNRESGTGKAGPLADDAVLRRQNPPGGKPRRPASLDLCSTPDKSVLGKFFRDGPDQQGFLPGFSEDNNSLRVDEPPGSPARSPGRRVSRFLRPDFYDTPREDSVFVKEKESTPRNVREQEGMFAKEKEGAPRNAKEVGGCQTGPRSKQANIASFLESNYADLERNIAKDLLAISENAGKQNSFMDPKKNAEFQTAGNGFNKRGSFFTGPKTATQNIAETGKHSASNSSAEINSGTSPRNIGHLENGTSITSTVGNGEKSQAALKAVGNSETVPATGNLSASSGSEFKRNSAVVGDSSAASLGVLKQDSNKDAAKETDRIKHVHSEQGAAVQNAESPEASSKVKLRKKVKKVDDAEASNPDSETSNADGKTSAKKKAASKAETNGSPSNKSKFMRSLDKTFEKFKSADGEANGKSRIKKVIRNLRESSLAPAAAGTSDCNSESSLVQRAVSVDDCSEDAVDKAASSNKIKKVIRSLKELATSPRASLDTENNLLKRATSIDDLSNPSQTKSNQVNSVLGKFKRLEDPRSDKKASLMSRFRRTQSVYSGSSSDGVLARDPGGAIGGDKSNRNSLGFDGGEVDYGGAAFEGGSAEAKKNADSETGSTAEDMSCTMRVKAPRKEPAAEKAVNGIPKGDDDDVSISATVKVVKVCGGNGTGSDGDANSGTPQTDGGKAASKIPLPGRASNTNGDSGKEERFKDAHGTVYPGASDRRKTNQSDPISLMSDDESESFDSCSVGSDWELRTMSPLPPHYHPHHAHTHNAAGGESMEERIRRKSFYSRFNDPKKKQTSIRKHSATGGAPALKDVQPRRSSSFVNYDAAGKPF